MNDKEHTDKRYYELADKFLNGSITPEEERDLTDWYDRRQSQTVDVPAAFAKDEKELKKRMWLNINAGIKPGVGKVSYRLPKARMAAAVIILALGVAGFYYYSNPSATETAGYHKPVEKAILPPLSNADKNSVSITLDDGSTIFPDEQGKGVVSEQGTTKLVKLQNGLLSYQPAGSNIISPKVSYNTVRTPRGGQYQIILPDNSKVWLNAASSLRFPTAFTGKERSIELSGEGYFEVEKNKTMPFTVQVNGMKVAVLGTHFNVMAYSEEPEVKTTLMEGSVSITKGSLTAMLKPGEQAKVRDDGTLKVSHSVNLDEVIAWKNGEFRFENASVYSIMTQISRWYDVSVQYKSNMRDVGFSGVIARTKDVSQILEILEAARCFHYKLEGKTVVISSYITQ